MMLDLVQNSGVARYSKLRKNMSDLYHVIAHNSGDSLIVHFPSTDTLAIASTARDTKTLLYLSHVVTRVHPRVFQTDNKELFGLVEKNCTFAECEML